MSDRPQLPPTPRRPVVDAYHGVEVVDDYRWLEDRADPEVRAWSDAQNRVTRAHLDALPAHLILRERVADLLGTSVRYGPIGWRDGRLFALKLQPPLQQVLLVAISDLDDLSTEQVVVDPNALDPTGSTAIDWAVPSLDGALVAVSLSVGGSEDGTLHVFDTRTAQEAGERIPQVRPGLPAGASPGWRDRAPCSIRAIRARASGTRRTSTSTSRSGATSWVRRSSRMRTTWAATSRGSPRCRWCPRRTGGACSPESRTATAATPRSGCATRTAAGGACSRSRTRLWAGHSDPMPCGSAAWPMRRTGSSSGCRSMATPRPRRPSSARRARRSRRGRSPATASSWHAARVARRGSRPSTWMGGWSGRRPVPRCRRSARSCASTATRCCSAG